MLRQLHDCVVHPSDPEIPVPKVLQVRLTPEILQLLLKSDGKDVSINFDQDMDFRIGKHRHAFAITPESASINIYEHHSTLGHDQSLKFSGAVSHRLTMRRELGDSVSEKLKSRQAEEAAAKQGRSVQTLDTDPRKHKRSTSNGKVIPSVIRSDSPARQSPFLQARKSPLLVASAAKAASVSLKTRTMQALATCTSTKQDLSTRLKVPLEALTAILPMIAHAIDDEWALNDDQFEHLKIWDWKGYTTAERGSAISRASDAFDRMGLDIGHAARIKLIHPDKRVAEDKNDTSPLSLNGNIDTTRVTESSPQKDGNVSTLGTTIERGRPRAINETSSRVTQSPTSQRKVTARGILSAGSTLIKNKKSEGARTADKPRSAAAHNRSAKSAASPASEPYKEHAAGSRRKDTMSSHSRHDRSASHGRLVSSPIGRSNTVRATDDSSRGRSTEPTVAEHTTVDGRKTAPGTVERHTSPGLETKLKKTEACKASLTPMTTSSTNFSDDVDSHRTSSITSTSTVRSDRSTVSSSSTAPSSLAPSSPPLPPSSAVKIRSKFLVTKSTPSRTLLSSGSPVGSPKIPQRPSSPCVVPQSTLIAKTVKASPDNVNDASPTRKRKVIASPEASQAPQAKRLQTIDLHDMARDYKRLYPEYKELYAEVTDKLGDAALFTKFMEMHNQMSGWKQTLYAENKGSPAEDRQRL